MGHSHAIYNATDKPVQWMNINVTAFHGQYDAFDLGDGRVGAPIDPVPQFMAMQLDQARMQQVGGAAGRQGHRAVPPRAGADRVPVDVGVRRSPRCCPPAHRSGPGSEPGIGGFYYVMNGAGHRDGRGGDGARSRPATRFRSASSETKAFENTGTAPLEFLVVGIARDMNKKNDMLSSPAPRLGGPGPARGAGPGRGRGL